MRETLTGMFPQGCQVPPVAGYTVGVVIHLSISCTITL